MNEIVLDEPIIHSNGNISVHYVFDINGEKLSGTCTFPPDWDSTRILLYFKDKFKKLKKARTPASPGPHRVVPVAKRIREDLRNVKGKFKVR